MSWQIIENGIYDLRKWKIIAAHFVNLAITKTHVTQQTSTIACIYVRVCVHFFPSKNYSNYLFCFIFQKYSIRVNLYLFLTKCPLNHCSYSDFVFVCSSASQDFTPVLPAVLPWVGHISWVRSICDVTTHFAVSVWRQQGPCSHHHTQTVVKSVPLLWSVLREEAVA